MGAAHVAVEAHPRALGERRAALGAKQLQHEHLLGHWTGSLDGGHRLLQAFDADEHAVVQRGLAAHHVLGVRDQGVESRRRRQLRVERRVEPRRRHPRGGRGARSSNATGINGNHADRSIPNAGAVYVFTRSGTTWSQQAYIKASNTGTAAQRGKLAEGNQFGYSIGLSDDGDTLAVGAIARTSNATGINGNQTNTSAGGRRGVRLRALRHDVVATGVRQVHDDAPENVLFGYSVGVSENGNTLAVAEYDADRGKGALYVLVRNKAQRGHTRLASRPTTRRTGTRSGIRWP